MKVQCGCCAAAPSGDELCTKALMENEVSLGPASAALRIQEDAWSATFFSRPPQLIMASASCSVVLGVDLSSEPTFKKAQR